MEPITSNSAVQMGRVAAAALTSAGIESSYRYPHLDRQVVVVAALGGHYGITPVPVGRGMFAGWAVNFYAAGELHTARGYRYDRIDGADRAGSVADLMNMFKGLLND